MLPWKQFQMDSMTAGTVVSIHCKVFPSAQITKMYMSQIQVCNWALIIDSHFNCQYILIGLRNLIHNGKVFTPECGKQGGRTMKTLAITPALTLPPPEPPRNRRVSSVLSYS